MIRLKNFDATGIAPNGVLYAGDLNALEDAVAAITDLTQNLSVGTLALGESGLQLIRYGTLEARLTGALRTDGIIRGLGGLFAGSFTSTARDAIPTGSRPYGLVILNTTTNRLEYNAGTDPSPVWAAMVFVAPPGTLASRPSATIGNAGGLYLATDVNGGTLYMSTGSTWSQAGLGVTQTTSASAINTQGTLGGRGTAVAGAGVTYYANDDHGGQLYETDNTAWHKVGSPVNGEWPIGSMIDWPWPAAQIPSQTILPYAQAISRTVYADLNGIASTAGYLYGNGDGSTTFNVIDMRGRVPVGKDDMGGGAANRITAAISGVSGATLGAVFGAEGITLTTAQLPAHNHGITGSPSLSGSPALTGSPGISDPSHIHNYNQGSTSSNTFLNPNGGGSNSSSNSPPLILANTTGITINAGSLAVNAGTLAVGVGTLGTSNQGSGSAHQNTQPSIIVNIIMRAL